MPKQPTSTAPFPEGPRTNAPEGPRINMTTVLLSLDGEPIADDFGLSPMDPRRSSAEAMAKLPHLTLGRAAWHALFARLAGDEKLSGGELWAHGNLAERIRDDESAALTTEEVRLLKNRIGAAYNVEVVMRAMPLLDPNATPPVIK